MNPYEILGVSENASSEEIKKAYHTLVKKYHPDKYHDNPLSELAEEKMREINKAYDMLDNNQRGSGNTWKGEAASSGRGQDFAQIRQYIQNGNVGYAESLLYKIKIRNAEWFFLKGVVDQRKGFYNDAVQNVAKAVQLDPNNAEYREYYSKLQDTGAVFRGGSQTRGYNQGGDALCNFCTCLACSDCCCEMGSCC